MYAIVQRDDNSGSREADAIDLGAKLKGNDGLLFRVIPYDYLVKVHELRASFAAAWLMLTDLILREFRLFSSSYQCYVVGSTQHFCYANTSIEILKISDQLKGLESRDGRFRFTYLVKP